MLTDSVNPLVCSQAVRSDIRSAVQGLEEALHPILEGIWLGGSLARGCYSQGVSDVDLLVVASEPVGSQSRERALGIIRPLVTPFDIVVVRGDQLVTDSHPTPIDFLVKMNHEIVQFPEGSRDFLLARQDVAEAGIALVTTADTIDVPPVPWHLVEKSILCIFPHVTTRFHHPALSLCKAIHAIRMRRLSSKKEAGEWGLAEAGARFRSLIQDDLTGYLAGAKPDLEPNLLRDFESDCNSILRSRNCSNRADGLRSRPG